MSYPYAIHVSNPIFAVIYSYYHAILVWRKKKILFLKYLIDLESTYTYFMWSLPTIFGYHWKSDIFAF